MDLFDLSKYSHIWDMDLYFLALKEGSVKNVMTIDRLSIVFAIIFSAIFLKESITYKTIIGMVVFLSGAVLLIYYH